MKKIISLFMIMALMFVPLNVNATSNNIFEESIATPTDMVSINNLQNRAVSYPYNLDSIPQINEHFFVVYNEGYRQNRLECCVFDIRNDDSQQYVLYNGALNLSDYTKYVQIMKYYYDNAQGKWIGFESSYPRISDSATGVLYGNVDIYFHNSQTWLRAGVDPYTPDLSIEPQKYEYNGHYYAIFDVGMKWSEAKDYCESLGGHLATITTAEEQDFIESIIENGEKAFYLIGATDEEVNGQWKWITGEEFSYSNWENGQPDGGNIEKWLMMFRIPSPWNSNPYTWNDINNEIGLPNSASYFNIPSAGFICEWNKKPQVTDSINIKYNRNLLYNDPDSLHYEITIIIENTSDDSLNKVDISVSIDEGINLVVDDEIYENSLHLSIDSLLGNQAINRKWYICVPLLYDKNGERIIKDRELAIDTLIRVDNGNAYTYNDILIVKSPVPLRESLQFYSDTWSFLNYKVDKIKLVDINLVNKLKDGRSETEKAFIDSYLREPHNGQCYGMAVIPVLIKDNALFFETIHPLSSTTSKLFDIPKDEYSESIIGYFHVTQNFAEIDNHINKFLKKSNKEKLEYIEILALQSQNDNIPFVLGMTSPESSHCVTAFGMETGEYRFGSKKYDSRILVYDNESLEWSDNNCLYYNKGTGDWLLPIYENKYTDILMAANSTIVNIANLEDDIFQSENSSKITVLSESDKYKLTSDNWDVIVDISNPGVSQTSNGIELAHYFEFGGESSRYKINIEEKEQNYKLQPINNNDGNISTNILYENFYLEYAGNTYDSIYFSPCGDLKILSNNGTYAMNVAGDLGIEFSSIKVVGNTKGDISLCNNVLGYIFEGDTTNEIEVIANNEDLEQKLTLSTHNKKILITEKNKILTAYIDNDNDNIYETLLASATNYYMHENDTSDEYGYDPQFTENRIQEILYNSSYIGYGINTDIWSYKENDQEGYINQQDRESNATISDNTNTSYADSNPIDAPAFFEDNPTDMLDDSIVHEADLAKFEDSIINDMDLPVQENSSPWWLVLSGFGVLLVAVTFMLAMGRCRGKQNDR